MFARKKPKGLEAAQAVMEERGKLQRAIDSSVTDLQEAVTARDKAARDLAIASVSGASEAEGAALNQAASRVTATSSKLGVLRDRLVALGPALCQQYDAVRACLPEHRAELLENFTPRWEKACAAYSQVLSERAALEGLLGEPLELGEPQPAPVQLDPNASRPSGLLAEIRAAIEDTASMREERGRVYAYDPNRPCDPLASYQLVQSACGFPPGSIVVEAMLPPGRLATMIQLGEAVPPQDSAAVAGVQACVAKLNEIGQLEADEVQRKSAAWQRARGLELDAKGGVDFKIATPYPYLSPAERAKRLRASPEELREKEENYPVADPRPRRMNTEPSNPAREEIERLIDRS
ncbi:MAG: hypothetical protein IT158_24080 [Bryobacterales bacterium]|nr:hypothetical protein [Bryobacterales bacterium]